MEKSGLFNSKNGDRLYNAKSFAKFYSLILANGIFYNPATSLQVVAIDNTMKVRIEDGFAFINGYYYENKNSLGDELTFTLPSSPNGDIIYRIILRLDSETNRLIRAFEIHSSIGENPISPKLMREEDIYDICLAEIKIKEGQTFIKQSDIIDTRLSEKLCGIVRVPLEHLKTEEVFRQFQEWFKEQKEKLGIDLDKWQTEHKEEYVKFEKEQKKSFEDWFIKVVKILGENPNANLINEMDKLRKDMANLVEIYKKETYKNIEQLKEMIKTDPDVLKCITSINDKTDKNIILKANDIKCDNNKSIEDNLKQINNNIGEVNELKTNSKKVIQAINEVFQSANNGKNKINSLQTELDNKNNDIKDIKNKIKEAIVGKGGSVDGDNIQDLINGVDNIKTGKKFASGDLGRVNVECKSESGALDYSIKIPLNIDFTPSLVVVELSNGYIKDMDIENQRTSVDDLYEKITISNNNQSSYHLRYNAVDRCITGKLTLHDNIVSVYVGTDNWSHYQIFGYNIKWYAIE